METPLAILPDKAVRVDIDTLARGRLLLLDSTKEGIYRIDEDGRCVFMNVAAGRMLGYGLGEALGQPMHELHHHSSKDGVPIPASGCPIHGIFSGPEPRSIETGMFWRRDGTHFPVECSAQPILEDGVYRGSVVTFGDIATRLKPERSWQTQYEVSRLLGRNISVEEALPKVLKAIADGLEFEFGAWWRADPRSDVLRLAACHFPASCPFDRFETHTRKISFARGEGTVGSVWASGEPAWIPQPDREASCREITAAGGPRSGFAVPVRLGQTTLGVMEFYSREPQPEDPDLLRAMAVAGDAVAQFIVRSRSEQSNARLVAILEAARDFVGVATDSRGTILSVNHAVVDMFGYTRAETLGRSLALLIPEYGRYLQENLSTEKEPAHAPPRQRIHLRGLHKSGRSIPLELSVGLSRENGRRVITAIVSDISDRKAAEQMLDRQAEDLRQSEKALRDQTRVVQSIVASMGDGVAVADENGCLLLINPAAKTLMPLGGLEFLPGEHHVWNGSFRPYLPDGVTPYPGAELPLARAVRGESVDEAQLFVRTPARPEGLWLSETARPLRDEEGALHGGVVITRDVTEQKRSAEALRQAKEEAESANRAKSEFLSRMSHELRTPMNSILGFAQLLELDELNPEQTDGVDRILKSGRHLLGLINEVLDIARIEAGRVQLEIEGIRAHEVMRAALELVHPLMAQRNIKLICPQAGACPWLIDADRQRLTQVFLNILANAVKYNRENGSVSISFAPAGRRLRVNVADTGLGIAPGNIHKLFRPFERLGAEGTGVEGTGLGLSLCEQLVRLMNGTIGVESTVGEGSVFYVDMEMSTQQAGSATAHAGRTAYAGRTGRASLSIGGAKDIRTVLYIEDNLFNFKLIEAILNRVPGFRVISAMQGSLGLGLAREHQPDLVLLDLMLPDISGLEVLRSLQRDPETAHIPVIIVSADATDGSREELLQAGANAYLTKPIKIKEFLDVITGIL